MNIWGGREKKILKAESRLKNFEEILLLSGFKKDDFFERQTTNWKLLKYFKYINSLDKLKHPEENCLIAFEDDFDLFGKSIYNVGIVEKVDPLVLKVYEKQDFKEKGKIRDIGEGFVEYSVRDFIDNYINPSLEFSNFKINFYKTFK